MYIFFHTLGLSFHEIFAQAFNHMYMYVHLAVKMKKKKPQNTCNVNYTIESQTEIGIRYQ